MSVVVLLDRSLFFVVLIQRVSSCFKCSMRNMALFLRWIPSESRSSSMISYCVIVSSVVGVEALSGVTEVLLILSGAKEKPPCFTNSWLIVQ